MMPEIRTSYVLTCSEKHDDYYADDDGRTLAICWEELIKLFPAAEDKILITFSNRPISNIALVGKFKVVPYTFFSDTLLNDATGHQYDYLYSWLRREIAYHKDKDGFVFIGVQNYDSDILHDEVDDEELTDSGETPRRCDRCGLECDSEGFCKYGCDDFS